MVTPNQQIPENSDPFGAFRMLLPGATKTTSTNVSPEGVLELMRQFAENKGGLAQLMMGGKAAGSYNSTANAQRVNALMARAAAEAAAKTASTTTKTGPEASLSDLLKLMAGMKAAGALGIGGGKGGGGGELSNLKPVADSLKKLLGLDDMSALKRRKNKEIEDAQRNFLESATESNRSALEDAGKLTAQNIEEMLKQISDITINSTDGMANWSPDGDFWGQDSWQSLDALLQPGDLPTYSIDDMLAGFGDAGDISIPIDFGGGDFSPFLGGNS